ncbi:MAG: RHS repeat-associated core domain-containing protein [Planctomycetota bacterium]
MAEVPVQAAPDDTGGEAGVDTYRHFFYDAGWQILETRVTDPAAEPPETENTAPQDLEPEYQYVWSARYIDAPILRDKNTDQDGLCDDGRMGRIDIHPHSAWKNAQGRILHHGHLTDANMNVTALFSTAGVALERYTYDAYGHTTVYDPDWESDEDGTDYDNVILFAGYYRDPETWFYHVRNRSYHAELGRWHQRDPIGYADGMSLHEYVGSRPTTYHDPFGLAGFWCCKAWSKPLYEEGGFSGPLECAVAMLKDTIFDKEAEKLMGNSNADEWIEMVKIAAEIVGVDSTDAIVTTVATTGTKIEMVKALDKIYRTNNRYSGQSPFSAFLFRAAAGQGPHAPPPVPCIPPHARSDGGRISRGGFGAMGLRGRTARRTAIVFRNASVPRRRTPRRAVPR